MPLPEPRPGLVIRYAYLWRSQERRGLEEGRKDRPCVVILAVEDKAGEQLVTVAPITHTPPEKEAYAVELPAQTKQRLGLDEQPSWIVATEVNRFVWPGVDLRPVDDGSPATWSYGLLPARVFEALRARILALGRLSVVRR